VAVLSVEVLSDSDEDTEGGRVSLAWAGEREDWGLVSWDALLLLLAQAKTLPDPEQPASWVCPKCGREGLASELKGFSKSARRWCSPCCSAFVEATSVADEERREWIEQARYQHQNDECRIDDDAKISDAPPDGVWVQAWLWMNRVEEE